MRLISSMHLLGGLQGELKNFVNMLKHTTLDGAVTLARPEEGGFNNLLAKVISTTTTKNFGHSTQTTSTHYKNQFSIHTTNSNPNIKPTLPTTTNQKSKVPHFQLQPLPTLLHYQSKKSHQLKCRLGGIKGYVTIVMKSIIMAINVRNHNFTF